VVVRRSLTPPLARGGAILSTKMYYVYLLQSQKDKKFYVGYSSNLKLRFAEHRNGMVEATKFRRPLDLVYYEAYNKKKAA
jgi:putative endonuclease